MRLRGCEAIRAIEYAGAESSFAYRSEFESFGRAIAKVAERSTKEFSKRYFGAAESKAWRDSFKWLAMIYPALKLIHLVSATILFGGGIFAALLGTVVFGSRKAKLIAEVGPHIVKVESWLTVLSALAQIVTGLWLASLAGFPVLTGWLGWALFLFCVAGLCWILGVWLQHRMVDLSRKAVETHSELPVAYQKHFRNWTLLGLPSTTAMIGIFYLMVFKPG